MLGRRDCSPDSGHDPTVARAAPTGLEGYQEHVARLSSVESALVTLVRNGARHVIVSAPPCVYERMGPTWMDFL